MVYIQGFAKYFLTISILGYLSATGASFSSSEYVSEHSEGSETSHRGSGRLVTQAPQETFDTLPTYRGTGRAKEQDDPALSHRGSGRVRIHVVDMDTISYRGSGRISPTHLDVDFA
ncbi:hypothetical protein PN498_12445 [Oscillatoria sp. CS-180]|uniref:hypothetical protein n=1 Tax=Oscillatoria sp. CS-180 TaxID=3021720 RepID=UPI00232DCA2B|nr:hypothetical protein [Oscillatoria sp. CS-180]MDB9526801.1 hypothetical protein [Oscillatoria sp. CS-180]